MEETPQDSPTAGKRWMKLDWDEWYPVYELKEDSKAYGISVELTEETIEWVLDVQTAFQEVQEFLDTLRLEMHS